MLHCPCWWPTESPSDSEEAGRPAYAGVDCPVKVTHLFLRSVTDHIYYIYMAFSMFTVSFNSSDTPFVVLFVWTAYWQIERCWVIYVDSFHLHVRVPHTNLINSSPSSSWHSAFSRWRGSWLICPSVCLFSLTSIALKGKNYWWLFGL